MNKINKKAITLINVIAYHGMIWNYLHAERLI